MSLYRQAGRASGRVIALVAAAAAVVGLIAGFAVGRATAPDPTLAEKIAELRSELRPAEQGMELTATEYSQAVRGGRVVAPTEYEAAQEAIGRAADSVAASRTDLRALDAAKAAALDRAIAAVRAAIQRRAEPAEVQRLSDEGRAALRAAVGRA